MKTQDDLALTLIRNLNKEKEKFIKNNLNKYLNRWDKILFKINKKWVISNPRKIMLLEKNIGDEGYEFGIQIYGKQVWTCVNWKINITNTLPIGG